MFHCQRRAFYHLQWEATNDWSSPSSFNHRNGENNCLVHCSHYSQSSSMWLLFFLSLRDSIIFHYSCALCFCWIVVSPSMAIFIFCFLFLFHDQQCWWIPAGQWSTEERKHTQTQQRLDERAAAYGSDLVFSIRSMPSLGIEYCQRNACVRSERSLFQTWKSKTFLNFVCCHSDLPVRNRFWQRRWLAQAQRNGLATSIWLRRMMWRSVSMHCTWQNSTGRKSMLIGYVVCDSELPASDKKVFVSTSNLF